MSIITSTKRLRKQLSHEITGIIKLLLQLHYTNLSIIKIKTLSILQDLKYSNIVICISLDCAYIYKAHIFKSLKLLNHEYGYTTQVF